MTEDFLPQGLSSAPTRHEYFARYLSVLEDDEEVSAWFIMLNQDLSDFNVHRRPQAVEHNNQKIKSLGGIKNISLMSSKRGNSRGKFAESENLEKFD